MINAEWMIENNIKFRCLYIQKQENEGEGLLNEVPPPSGCNLVKLERYNVYLGDEKIDEFLTIEKDKGRQLAMWLDKEKQ